MNIRQEIQLTQALAMTPALYQAISLLQLSALELRAFAEQEVQENLLREWENSIRSLNPVGYLEQDPILIATQASLPLSIVLRTLKKAQRCEPVAIFAHNLKKCLRLQSQDQVLYGPTMQLLLRRLEVLTQGGIQHLAKTIGLSFKECQVYLSCPASVYEVHQTETIIPDAFVTKRDSLYVVELNSQTLPYLYVNSDYYFGLLQQFKKSQDIRYLQEKMGRPHWLLRALHQRTSTLLRVCEEIVRLLIRQEPIHQPLSDQLLMQALQREGIRITRRTMAKYRENLAISSSMNRRRRYTAACSGA